MSQNILVTGATGFVGAALVERLQQAGYNVFGLSRNATRAAERRPDITWFGWSHYSAMPEFADGTHFDIVVHLAGESVVGRWTDDKKTRILGSRSEGTQRLVEALARLDKPPTRFVSASAIGYYGERGDDVLTESEGPGSDFLAEVCAAWEEGAQHARRLLNIEPVLLRIGLVLGKDGGPLDSMQRPYKLGLGGPMGSGKQWWSWIHLADMVDIILGAVRGELEGTLNCVAPEVLRQKEFSKILASALGRPAFLPAPAFAIKAVLGEFSAELLTSKRVVPEALKAQSFAFQYPTLESALKAIYVTH